MFHENSNGPHYKRLFEERKKTAKNKSIKYHGLTRRIVEIWPDKPIFCTASKGENKNKLWCGHRDAKAHGNVVDEELSLYAKLGQEKFVRERGHGVVDPCSLAVICWLRTQKLTLLLSQYVMYDDSNAVKTHLDLLAIDAKHELVLIELKATIEGDDDSYRGKDRTAALSKASHALHNTVNSRFLLLGKCSHNAYHSAIQDFIDAYHRINSKELLSKQQLAKAAQAVFLQDMKELYREENKNTKKVQRLATTTQKRLHDLTLLHLADERTTLPNSYYVRHMIQLVMMLKILRSRYNIKKLTRGYVLRVGGGNLWLYPVDRAIMSAHVPIYDSFSSSSQSSS